MLGQQRLDLGVAAGGGGDRTPHASLLRGLDEEAHHEVRLLRLERLDLGTQRRGLFLTAALTLPADRDGEARL